jgi:Ala-tRNA(Pro) deacylase
VYPAYERIIADLRGANVPFEEMRHEPEGDTEAASVLRGHPLAWAVKSLVVEVRVGDENVYVLAAIPGDARVDFGKIEQLVGGTSADFAAPGTAADLAGSESGTFMPFVWDDRLELIADPALFDAPELVFNAGRLDRSIAIASAAYRHLANPRVEAIT